MPANGRWDLIRRIKVKGYHVANSCNIWKDRKYWNTVAFRWTKLDFPEPLPPNMSLNSSFFPHLSLGDISDLVVYVFVLHSFKKLHNSFFPPLLLLRERERERK